MLGQCMYLIVCVGSGIWVYIVGGSVCLNTCRIVDVGATAFVFSAMGRWGDGADDGNIFKPFSP